jgi:hypothetical protein
MNHAVIAIRGKARSIRPDVADAPECAMTDQPAATAKTALPAIPAGFSALAGCANFGEIGDLIDHQSGIAMNRADQRGQPRRNRRAI